MRRYTNYITKQFDCFNCPNRFNSCDSADCYDAMSKVLAKYEDKIEELIDKYKNEDSDSHAYCDDCNIRHDITNDIICDLEVLFDD